jgi:hypothetical protein
MAAMLLTVSAVSSASSISTKAKGRTIDSTIFRDVVIEPLKEIHHCSITYVSTLAVNHPPLARTVI